MNKLPYDYWLKTNPPSFPKFYEQNHRHLTRPEYDIYIKNSEPSVCKFCDWKNQQLILKEFKYWLFIDNIAPYWWWHTMVISKRHFVGFDEMTPLEAAELPIVYSHVKKKFIDTELRHADGSLVDRYVYFGRDRVNRVDLQTGAVKPDHFHISYSPDRDHSWDSTHEAGAETCDVVGRLGES